MTHGPAMSVNGLAPFPMATAPIWTEFIRNYCSAGLQACRLSHRFGLRALMCRFVPVAGFDEACKQRMRPRGLRLELRVELHGEKPRVAGHLGNLDELPVW